MCAHIPLVSCSQTLNPHQHIMKTAHIPAVIYCLFSISELSAHPADCFHTRTGIPDRRIRLAQNEGSIFVLSKTSNDLLSINVFHPCDTL